MDAVMIKPALAGAAQLDAVPGVITFSAAHHGPRRADIS
jgi:hypothetical protein